MKLILVDVLNVELVAETDEEKKQLELLYVKTKGSLKLLRITDISEQAGNFKIQMTVI